MNKDRWQLLERLYHEALEYEPAARTEFVMRACAGDEELCSELIALLAYDGPAESFIERQALEVAARALALDPQFEVTENEPVATGRIGHYELQGLLGEGGMGKVYLAFDTRLGRKVAIKQLPAEFIADAERVRRFEQEARLASGLSHPNIITIHEIGHATTEAGETRYIVTEYIDGETLRHRMTSAPLKRLPPSETLKIGLQIADALAAAHEAGIVHRDIKPENVMIRRDGYAKVLDFGLAKLFEGQTSELEAEVSTAHLVSTNPGLIMGTACYMSPEQTRGLKVDARTDIFSLGVVIYEMLAGVAPFQGQTATDVMASILMKEPAPLSNFNPSVPVELQRTIDKCLAKECSNRYRTARELIHDLQQVVNIVEGRPTHDSDKSSLVREPQKAAHASGRLFYARAIISLLSVALLLAAFFIIARYLHSGPTTTPEKMTRLVSNADVLLATISPNGEHLTYVSKEGGRQSLRLMRIATGEEIQKIPAADFDYLGLTFSPDGNHLYYVVNDLSSKLPGEPLSALYSIPAVGGTPRKIIERLDSPVSFSPDGQRFAFVREYSKEGISALMVCNSDGRGEARLAERKLPFYFDYPAWSPDGNVIACTATGYSEGKHLEFFDPQGKKINNAASSKEWPFIHRIQWVKGGDRLVLSVFDFERKSVQLWTDSYPGGVAARMTNDLNDYMGVSLTADSRELVSVERRRLTGIWTGERLQEGYAMRSLRPLGDYDKVSWAPDGRIIYSEKSGEDWNVWAVGSDGDNLRQLTFGKFGDQEASLSADGRILVFVRTAGERASVWRMNIDDGNLQDVSQKSTAHTPELSRDGRWIVYTAPGSTSWSALWRVPIEGVTALN